MRVMVIVKSNAESESGQMPGEELLTEMGAYNEELVKAGLMETGEGLFPSAHGARIMISGTERTVVSGPFPETNQMVAGFWIWKVDSLEDAIAWAKRCPNPTGTTGALEIRPILSTEDFGEALTPELRAQEERLRAEVAARG